MSDASTSIPQITLQYGPAWRVIAEGDDGGTSTITWHRGHVEREDDDGKRRIYARPSEDTLSVTGPLAALVGPLIEAAIAAAEQSGIGSDAVWEIARQIKALRASR
jgi:hypothetical protein